MTLASTLDLLPRASADAQPAHARASERGEAHLARDVQFEIIGDRDAFDRLRDEWEALFERAGRSTQVFQTHNWLSHWLDHFGGEATLAILAGRRDGRLVVVWPLVRQRRAGLRILSWAGAPVSQYGDALLDEVPDGRAVLAASWEFIVSAHAPDVVQLAKVRADAVVAPLLREVGAIVTQHEIAPYLDLASAPTMAAYEERFTSKAKKNRRRFMRRLQERGAVAVEINREGEAGRARVGAIMSMKRAWLRERGLLSAAFADPRFERFFTAVAGDASRPTGARVSVLTANGQIAAAEIAFACKGRLAVHIITYASKFAKLSAGSLLIEASLRCAKEEGLSTFDLLAPGDDYKLEWADGSVDVLDWAAPFSRRGEVFARLYLGWLRPRVKRVILATPPALRRPLCGFAGVTATVV